MSSSLENTAQLAIDLLKEHDITDYEISLSSGSGISTAVRLGKVETLEYHLDKSFSINVYMGNKKGHASSVDLSRQSISKTIGSACLIAKYTQNDAFNGLAPKELMAFNPPDLDLYYPWGLDSSDSIELAMRCEAKALEQKYINNSDGAELSSFQGKGLYVNSHGMMAVQQGAKHSLHCSIIAKQGKDMQTAYEYTSALDSNDLELPEVIGQKVARLAINKLGARSLVSQKCSVIFTPRLSGGLFAELIGALSGARQYKKSTFLLGSIEQKVMPNGISLLENPLIKKTIGAKPFDQDGVLKRRQYFVKDGQVQSYIMGQYSANQLGLETTANAGGVNNVMIEHGFEGGLDEMVKDMHQGLIVTELMGQGVNDITGDYSRGALGFWVDNGKIQYPVSGITIAGNLKEILLGVERIGSDIDHRNNIKVGSVLVNQMTIAGGA